MKFFITLILISFISDLSIAGDGAPTPFQRPHPLSMEELANFRQKIENNSSEERLNLALSMLSGNTISFLKKI